MEETDVNLMKKNLALNFIANEILRIEIDLNSKLIVTQTTFISNMILATFLSTITLLSTGHTIWIPVLFLGMIILGLAGIKIIDKLLRKQIEHYLQEHRKQYFQMLENMERLPLKDIIK